MAATNSVTTNGVSSIACRGLVQRRFPARWLPWVKEIAWEDDHGFVDLAAGPVRPGAGGDGVDVCFPGRLRPYLKEPVMIWLTAAVTLFLLGYLLVALLRPEWF
jgi:K+-transporting ATPase KdpF subunit